MDIRTVFDLLVNNRKDMEEIVSDLGGLGNLLRLVGKLRVPVMNILKTINDHPDPPAKAQQISHAAVYYTDATLEKVRQFQAKHGLTADGIVGDRTWATIERLLP